jgi:hypothetical protein
MRSFKTLPLATIALTCLFFSIANLAIAKDQNGGFGKKEPPKEAIEACAQKYEGSECSMSTPHGDTITGKCIYTPDEKYFVCMPKDGPKPPRSMD